MSGTLRCVRPSLCLPLRRFHNAKSAPHVRFSSGREATASTENVQAPSSSSSKSPLGQDRYNALLKTKGNLYPRLDNKDFIPLGDFDAKFGHFKEGETDENIEVLVRGRVNSLRLSGSKLLFIDLVQEGHRVQGLCNLAKLSYAGISTTQFTDFAHSIRRGDIYEIKGHPHKTARGQSTVLATGLPKLLAPCLHDLPTLFESEQSRIRYRHVDLLVNERPADILRLRANIIEYIRSTLQSSGYIEMQTPILAKNAGGAIARPFQTAAVEFPDRYVALRTAPELWLKRLILAGFDRVFEIGPCFRNEGIANSSFMQEKYQSLPKLEVKFNNPFPQIDFFAGLNTALRRPLPDLSAPDAEDQLKQLFHDHDIKLPKLPTLPRLLDRLSSLYLESQCNEPTWITHYPECLSPLSKSFVDPDTKQRVAARAELFIQGREYVNTYEEENSPFEQRRKFVEQL
ncbi:MAG: hypothetical protein Q9167_007196, partial [Letrouitia subvulpina]